VQSKLDPIAHLISEIPMMPVVVMLVDVSEEIISFCHVLSDCLDPCFHGLIGADGGLVMTVDHPERCVTEHGLVGGVVDELRLGKPAQPLSRAISGEAVLLHDDDLAEAIHCREDDGLPAYVWKRLDEIKPNVYPDRCAHGQRQEQAGQV
jgi:hypothetical protein